MKSGAVATFIDFQHVHVSLETKIHSRLPIRCGCRRPARVVTPLRTHGESDGNHAFSEYQTSVALQALQRRGTTFSAPTALPVTETMAPLRAIHFGSAVAEPVTWILRTIFQDSAPGCLWRPGACVCAGTPTGILSRAVGLRCGPCCHLRICPVGSDLQNYDSAWSLVISGAGMASRDQQPADPSSVATKFSVKRSPGSSLTPFLPVEPTRHGRVPSAVGSRGA